MKARPRLNSVIAILVMFTLGACQGVSTYTVQPTPSLTATVSASPVPTAALPSSTTPSSALPSPSLAGWSSYANARYGYTVYYPAGWTAGPEADNSDGLVLTGDPTVTLTVYGTNATDTIANVHQQAINSAKGLGVVVTYQTSTPNRSVVSGTKGDTVYYSSAWCGKGSCNYLVFWYPTADKSTMDPLVTTITQRFSPGRLDQAN